MKKPVIVSLLTLLSFASAQLLAAESLFMKTVLMDNTEVHVFELFFKPGGASPEHTHDYGRVVYVLQGGTLDLVKADGTAVRKKLKPGKVVWRPAETHIVKNVGDSDVQLVEIEVKK